jgi:hypothetical protein
MPKATADEAHVAESCEQLQHDSKEVFSELIEVATEYAKANPGPAALWCLAVGFVMGWKLKPW